jgi:hypothetical protein
MHALYSLSKVSLRGLLWLDVHFEFITPGPSWPGGPLARLRDVTVAMVGVRR